MQKYKQSTSKEDRSERTGAHGVHGQEKAKTQRVRASGAGAKIEFPELYESTKHWLEAERAHGHVVLPRHVSWKYESSLDQEIARLEVVMKDEENPQQQRLLKDRIDRGKRQKKSLEKPKNQDKRARHLMSWMGAKVQAPNLVTQLSEVEQQVRAELTWNQFDFQTWKMSSKKDEVYHEMFAQPENAKKHVHQCVLGFSDQIPLWVKKPTSREVFAGFELRASAKSVSVHRQEIRQQLAQGATDKAAWPVQGEIVRAEGADGQIAEHDDPGLPFHEPSAHDAGKTHLTTMREVNVDKYRITFEAHQLVTGWFSLLGDEPSEPIGHVLPGVVIVPGPHASLDNISKDDEWIETESFVYMGQTRTHRAGEKVGRTLEPWRKLRKAEPHLLRHFSVMSQPSSNMDSVLMAWQVRDQAKKYPMSLWQRDCFGAALSRCEEDAILEPSGSMQCHGQDDQCIAVDRHRLLP